MYDYAAARAGRPGLHALLRSLLHSDGFFVSRILLAHANILALMADQIARRVRMAGLPIPEFVAGVPSGATTLGSPVAQALGSSVLLLQKVNGQMVCDAGLPYEGTVLLVEDFSTQGTGLRDAALAILDVHPSACIVPRFPSLLNRGERKEIFVEGAGSFAFLPVVEQRIQDRPADKCVPCLEFGSTAIKPKETDENWRLITTSQLAA